MQSWQPDRDDDASCAEAVLGLGVLDASCRPSPVDSHRCRAMGGLLRARSLELSAAVAFFGAEAARLASQGARGAPGGVSVDSMGGIVFTNGTSLPPFSGRAWDSGGQRLGSAEASAPGVSFWEADPGGGGRPGAPNKLKLCVFARADRARAHACVRERAHAQSPAHARAPDLFVSNVEDVFLAPPRVV